MLCVCVCVSRLRCEDPFPLWASGQPQPDLARHVPDATQYAHYVFKTIKHKQTGKVNFEVSKLTAPYDAVDRVRASLMVPINFHVPSSLNLELTPAHVLPSGYDPGSFKRVVIKRLTKPPWGGSPYCVGCISSQCSTVSQTLGSTKVFLQAVQSYFGSFIIKINK